MSDQWPVVDVWIIHRRKKILVTDFPGPPAEICVFLSEEARQAAIERGCATVSEIGFAQEDHPGSFEGPDAWEEALTLARAKAEELGYQVMQEDSAFVGWGEDDWEEEDEPEPWDLEWDFSEEEP